MEQDVKPGDAVGVCFKRSIGLKPGDLVGVCLARGLDLVVSLLAVLRCESAYAPLDPDCPQECIDYILGDAKVSLLITHSDLPSSVHPPSGVSQICLDKD